MKINKETEYQPLNSLIMKKTTYLQPIIKVVAFKVEGGFDVSPQVGAEHVVSDRLFRDDSYATGERFTEYTDNDGGFFAGRWED